MIELNGFSLQFSEFNFFLLVLSTVIIAAAGYIINDYFDTKIDRKNYPERVIVGRTVKRRVAIVTHIILNVIGVAIGFYIAYKVGIIELAYINVMCTGILWYYSTSFKYKVLIGNILIAFMAALVPLIVGLYEIPLLIKNYEEMLVVFGFNLNYVFAWIAGFSIFAFLTTLIREIIKDMEDIKGDMAYGSKTLPIVIGVRKSKIVVSALIVVTILLLGYIQLILLHDIKTFLYFLIAIHIPFIFLIYKTMKATGKDDFHLMSILVKLIMVTGVLYSVLVNVILIYEF